MSETMLLLKRGPQLIVFAGKVYKLKLLLPDHTSLTKFLRKELEQILRVLLHYRGRVDVPQIQSKNLRCQCDTKIWKAGRLLQFESHGVKLESAGLMFTIDAQIKKECSSSTRTRGLVASVAVNASMEDIVADNSSEHHGNISRKDLKDSLIATAASETDRAEKTKSYATQEKNNHQQKQHPKKQHHAMNHQQPQQQKKQQTQHQTQQQNQLLQSGQERQQTKKHRQEQKRDEEKHHRNPERTQHGDEGKYIPVDEGKHRHDDEMQHRGGGKQHDDDYDDAKQMTNQQHQRNPLSTISNKTTSKSNTAKKSYRIVLSLENEIKMQKCVEKQKTHEKQKTQGKQTKTTNTETSRTKPKTTEHLDLVVSNESYISDSSKNSYEIPIQHGRVAKNDTALVLDYKQMDQCIKLPQDNSVDGNIVPSKGQTHDRNVFSVNPIQRNEYGEHGVKRKAEYNTEAMFEHKVKKLRSSSERKVRNIKYAEDEEDGKLSALARTHTEEKGWMGKTLDFVFTPVKALWKIRKSTE